MGIFIIPIVYNKQKMKKMYVFRKLFLKNHKKYVCLVCFLVLETKKLKGVQKFWVYYLNIIME